MTHRVADELASRLVEAGVKRMYGIVGDSLNPVTDAVRQNGELQWIHVRHEENRRLRGRRRRPAEWESDGVRLGRYWNVQRMVLALPNVLSMPSHITADQVEGFGVAMMELVLSGHVDEVRKRSSQPSGCLRVAQSNASQGFPVIHRLEPSRYCGHSA